MTTCLTHSPVTSSNPSCQVQCQLIQSSLKILNPGAESHDEISVTTDDITSHWLPGGYITHCSFTFVQSIINVLLKLLSKYLTSFITTIWRRRTLMVWWIILDNGQLLSTNPHQINPKIIVLRSPKIIWARGFWIVGKINSNHLPIVVSFKNDTHYCSILVTTLNNTGY